MHLCASLHAFPACFRSMHEIKLKLRAASQNFFIYKLRPKQRSEKKEQKERNKKERNWDVNLKALQTLILIIKNNMVKIYIYIYKLFWISLVFKGQKSFI